MTEMEIKNAALAPGAVKEGQGIDECIVNAIRKLIEDDYIVEGDRFWTKSGGCYHDEEFVEEAVFAWFKEAREKDVNTLGEAEIRKIIRDVIDDIIRRC